MINNAAAQSRLLRFARTRKYRQPLTWPALNCPIEQLTCTPFARSRTSLCNTFAYHPAFDLDFRSLPACAFVLLCLAIESPALLAEGSRGCAAKVNFETLAESTPKIRSRRRRATTIITTKRRPDKGGAGKASGATNWTCAILALRSSQAAHRRKRIRHLYLHLYLVQAGDICQSAPGTCAS